MPTQGKKRLQAIDLFAGPGGWDLAAQSLGLRPLGIELDGAACATRKAAGLRTLQGDVAKWDPLDFGQPDLVIASSPCPTFSSAGKGEGMNDLPLIYEAADNLARNGDLRWGDRCSDSRSELVLEPLRWALALGPRFLAWEQVPPVLPFWEHCAEILWRKGWNVWTGKVEAERYGVPQTRERAILMADREAPVHPPRPTHQRYVKGEPQRHEHTLEGEVLPWVSMAEALGWSGVSQVRNYHADPGAPRTDGKGGKVSPTFDPNERPSRTLTHRVGGWQLLANATRCSKDGILVGRQLPEGEGENVGGHGWDSDEAESKPTAAGEAIRVSLKEALILQSFPGDYPVQGTKSQRYLQVGNAVPPLLAKAILEALIPAELLAQIQTPESQAA